MKSLKRILAVVLTFVLIFSMTACSGSGGEKAKFTSGKPDAVGDVFKLPDVKKSEDAKAPVIAAATRQVNTGDSITVTGQGFSADGLKVYIYAQSTKDNGKSYPVDFQLVSDIEIVVPVPESMEYGIYGVWVETANGKSGIELVNNPEIWWISMNEVIAGETVSVYGENLTTDNAEKSNIWLVSEDKYLAVEITYADPYKVSFTVPSGLKEGERYGILLHNGHGGEYGFAESEETIIFVSKKTMDFSGGNTVDVTKFGAKPDDAENNDGIAIENAILSAKDGDTIYFPKGTYIIDTDITVDKSLCFKGESLDNTKIIIGDNVQETVFDIKVGPSEFKNIHFSNVLARGKLKARVIRFVGDGTQTDYLNLYVHNCRFSQSTSPAAMSAVELINVVNLCGVMIKNNDFAATRITTTSKITKLFINNNKYYGMYCVGAYYDQNAMHITSTHKYDISGNYMCSMDAVEDKTHILDVGDRTVGRAIAIQGTSNKAYIADNEVVAAGLPNDNAGEQILLETQRLLYMGKPVSATENTITMSDDFNIATMVTDSWGIRLSAGSVVSVVLGPGMTQYRFISKIEGQTLTLSEPWDIVPTKDSTVTLCPTAYNIVIFRNKISGYKNYEMNAGATVGVQSYNDIYNLRIIDNYFCDMPIGINISGHVRFDGKDTSSAGNYWSIVSGNKIKDVCTGIRFTVETVPTKTQDEILFHTAYGVTIRRNTISDTTLFKSSNLQGIGGHGIIYGRTKADYSISPDSTTWLGSWDYGTVFENNVFENCAQHNILLCKHQGSTVLRGNVAKSGVKDIYTLENNLAEEPIVMD